MVSLKVPFNLAEALDKEIVYPPIYISFVLKDFPKGQTWGINLVESSNKISGLKIARGSWPITHLFLVDNSLLFYKSKLSEWLALQTILNT